ncbi:MAG: pyridoxamine 5'-phosphate oxidase family protein, partial [Dehalococcoidia bacterium]
MTDTVSFEQVAPDFTERVGRIVWCTAATVDPRGRPRTRILHPIWEGTTGWIGTGRHSPKEAHLAGNPHMSLTYWDPRHEQIYVECVAAWEDDPSERRRIWELFRATPPPLGYDPAMIWTGGPNDPTFGVLKLTPWRIELSEMGPAGFSRRVWRPAPA